MLAIIVILGLASAAASTTMGSSKLFKSLRSRVAARSTFLGDLVSCPYCLGHYISAFFVGGTLHITGAAGFNFDALTYWLATTAISGLASGALVRLYGD